MRQSGLLDRRTGKPPIQAATPPTMTSRDRARVSALRALLISRTRAATGHSVQWRTCTEKVAWLAVRTTVMARQTAAMTPSIPCPVLRLLSLSVPTSSINCSEAGFRRTLANFSTIHWDPRTSERVRRVKERHQAEQVAIHTWQHL